jgi:adenylylsulfate kinase
VNSLTRWVQKLGQVTIKTRITDSPMRSNNRSPSTPTGFTLWFTGLPCAGKSTLARGIGIELQGRGHLVEILDGDMLRTTLCKNLGFSRQDRDENIARIGWVCNTLNKHGVVAIGAVISPYRDARELLRTSIPRFVEIYVKAPLSVCIGRDIKGMYAKALAGKLSHFTGVDDPYEEPLASEIIVETDASGIAQCVRSIIEYLEKVDMLARPPDLHAGSHAIRSP